MGSRNLFRQALRLSGVAAVVGVLMLPLTAVASHAATGGAVPVAAAPGDTHWEITWKATATGHSDTTSGDSRYVFDHSLTMQGYALVTLHITGTTDINVFQMAVADDYKDDETISCSGGPAKWESIDTWSIVDPERWFGTVPEWPRFSIQVGHRADGSYFMPSPFIASQAGFWPFMTYLHISTLIDCSNNRFTSSGTSQQNLSIDSTIDCVGCVPGQPPLDFKGNAAGTDYSLQYQYTSQGSPPMTVTWSAAVHLVSGPDLMVNEVEVTQGLQDVLNDVPLVQGKRTVVRAYIGVAGDPGPIDGVTAKLTAYSGATKLGSTTPFNPGGRIRAKANPDWHQINDTLNFELPYTWTQYPSLHLVVEVNPDHSVTEVNYQNNDYPVDVTMRSCNPVDVAYMPMHYTPPGGYTPTDPAPNIADGDVFMRQVYPLAEDALTYVPWTPFNLRANINNVGVDYALLDRLNQILLASSAPHPDHIYGWLPSGAYTGNGFAQTPGTAAFGNDTQIPDRWRRTFAHEIGHNYGLPHGNLTTDGRHWFDVYDRVIKPVPASVGGSDLLDMMVPDRLESEAWISPTNYNYLVGKLCSGNSPAAPNTPSQPVAGGDHLLVTGLVFSSTMLTGSLDPIYHSTTAPISVPPAGGDYCLNLRNGITLLGQYCFDQIFEGDSVTPVHGMPFGMVITYPVGLNRVELTTGGGTLLASRVASAGSPTITLNFPNTMGLTFTGTQTITWTAADPDGDPLTYDLLYSRDNGATWIGLDSGITETSYMLNFANVAGASGGRLKVQASDGISSTEAVSALPFAVPNKPPIAMIIAPSSGVGFSPRVTVTLEGRGLDLQVGALGDSALSWTSSKDGALGTGRLLETMLSAGLHTITLTVTNSGGLSAMTSIQLNAGSQVFLPVVRKGP